MAVDRTTNKARLVPVANFYHMQQQIKGYTPQLPTDVRLFHLHPPPPNSITSAPGGEDGPLLNWGSTRRRTMSARLAIRGVR